MSALLVPISLPTVPTEFCIQPGTPLAAWVKANDGHFEGMFRVCPK
jgi:hypothetical protein